MPMDDDGGVARLEWTAVIGGGGVTGLRLVTLVMP